MRNTNLVLAGAFIMVTAAFAMAQSTDSNRLPSDAQPRASSELLWLQQESVGVTSDRAPRRTETVPSNITVITAEQVERSGAKHVPDLLKYYAGVEVTDFFDNGRQARVDLRGFGINTDSSTLVMVDGRRINGVTLFNTDWTTIPLDRIARIEIVRGGNSVLYGNQAVGGVINIITKRGTVEKEVVSGVDLGNGGYAKPYANFSGTSLLFNGVLTYNLSAGYTHSNGYRDNTDFRMETGGIALNYEKGNFLFDLTGGAKDDKYGLPGGLSLKQPRRSTDSPLDVAHTRDSYVHFVPGYRLSEHDRVSTALDYRPTRQSSQYFNYPSLWKDVVAQHGLAPQYTGEHRFGRVKNKLVSGFDYLKSDLTRDISSVNTESNSLISKAWYVHNVISTHEDTVHFDLGYRKESFRYDLRLLKINRDFGVHALRFGATWNYREASKLFATYDRSYRIQLLDEVGAFGGEILRPQISDQYQAGLGHRINSRLDMQMTYFRIDTRDEIRYDDNSWANANLPDTRRQGLDVELRARFNPRISGSLAYTHLDAKAQAGPLQGKKLPLSTPDKGAAGLTVSPFSNWWLSANYRLIAGRTMDGDVLQTGTWKDNWQVVDLVASHNSRNYSITAAVKNLLGERYAEYGYFYAPLNSVTIFPNQTRTLFVDLAFHHAF